MNVIRNTASPADAIEPAKPTSAPSASGTAFEMLCAPDCVLSAAPVSPRKPSSSEFWSCSTSLRQVLEEGLHPLEERLQQDETEQRHRDERADHGDRGRHPPSQRRLTLHQPNRAFEDQPEEDADRHDQERVADRDDRPREEEERQREEQRLEGDHDLQGPTVHHPRHSSTSARQRLSFGTIDGWLQAASRAAPVVARLQLVFVVSLCRAGGEIPVGEIPDLFPPSTGLRALVPAVVVHNAPAPSGRSRKRSRRYSKERRARSTSSTPTRSGRRRGIWAAS